MTIKKGSNLFIVLNVICLQKYLFLLREAKDTLEITPQDPYLCHIFLLYNRRKNGIKCCFIDNYIVFVNCDTRKNFLWFILERNISIYNFAIEFNNKNKFVNKKVDKMKRKWLVCFFAYISVNGFAQINDNEIPYHAVFTNGTIASCYYNKYKKVLKVEVRQNEDEVEVLAVKNGMVIDSESTFFMDDEVNLDLSNNGNGECDIYVKAKNEVQYVGSVVTAIKPENEKE